MNKTSLSITASILAALALSACASKPKPELAPAPTESRPGPESTEQGAERGGPVRTLQEDLAATAGDRVYFDLDSHLLSPDASATLERQAAWLARHPDVRVLVAGNCDERGTREYNIALGARRADAARNLLIARGVSASRIDTVSYGKERPMDPGSNDEAWSRNRNAHTVLIDAAASW